jgi:prefoldin subunit 5
MPEDDKLTERLARIEQTLEAFHGRLTALERALGATPQTRAEAGEAPIEAVLKKRVAELESDKLTLTQRVATLAEGRLQARP